MTTLYKGDRIEGNKYKLLKSESWETFDLTTGEPCPAVVTIIDASAGRVWVMVEPGIGVRPAECRRTA